MVWLFNSSIKGNVLYEEKRARFKTSLTGAVYTADITDESYLSCTVRVFKAFPSTSMVS